MFNNLPCTVDKSTNWTTVRWQLGILLVTSTPMCNSYWPSNLFASYSVPLGLRSRDFAQATGSSIRSTSKSKAFILSVPSVVSCLFVLSPLPSNPLWTYIFRPTFASSWHTFPSHLGTRTFVLVCTHAKWLCSYQVFLSYRSTRLNQMEQR